MTLIQCLSQSLLDNLVGCLRLRPEKLVLLGEQDQIRDPANQLMAIAKTRGITVDVELCPLPGKQSSVIAAALLKTVLQEPECLIDLTGCDEVAAMAVGIMLAQLPQGKHVGVQRYDWEEKRDIDCDGDGQVTEGCDARLSVSELIALHGGTIHPGTQQPPEGSEPDDLEAVWALARTDARAWNRSISSLLEFEKYSYSESEVLLPLENLKDSISDYKEKKARYFDILDQFRRRGVIQDFSRRNFIHYRYRSELLRQCTRMAGNILEMKVLLEALAMKEEDKPYFQDGRMGVHIDWDGVVYNDWKQIPETRNEIDVLLTRDMAPLFISCKNGDIDDEELYKLYTVATRFGGPSARKMLIVTDMDRGGQIADRSFIQRAKDMGIDLVTDAAGLSRKEWQEIFRHAMQ